jgi:hypothetical protein
VIRRTYFVAVAACDTPPAGASPGAGDAPRALGLEVVAPGARTAAAEGYLLAAGARRATWLLGLGDPADTAGVEGDVGDLAGALVELGRLRWPGEPGCRCPLELACFWLPRRPAGRPRPAALILVARRPGPVRPAPGAAWPGRESLN